MHFVALAASLLFTSSLSMTVSDSVWHARGGTYRAAEANIGGKRTFSYGDDIKQRIDFWPATGANALKGAPIVIFVHGGGWKRGDMAMMEGSAKLSHWHERGYAVASVNYRLVPDATVEQQAADVASAIAYLRRHAANLGVDPTRIALVGHSAGAHLVALVGTDPAYLKAAGLALGDLRGVVPLDGACYDVPAQLAEGPGLMKQTYLQAFGRDPARQRKLSPTFQAGTPNAPEFLILHVQRADGTRQSEELGAALRKAGTPVAVKGFGGRGLRGHMEINRELGNIDYPPTQAVDTFLARIFA